MTGRITLMGTGTSFGVPVIGCSCEVCTSDDPRDKRTRVSAVIQLDNGPTLLIDTPPEIRLQLAVGSAREELERRLSTARKTRSRSRAKVESDHDE